MSALLKSSLIVILFMSLVTLTSCGKKDSGETTGDNKESTQNSESKDGDDGYTGGDIDMSSGEFMITYDMEGKQMKGTMTLYKMGKKFKTDMKGSAGSMDEMNSTAISDGDYVYSIVDVKGVKKGIKMKISDYSDKDDFGNMADVEKELSKYKVVGTETILGKECEIYDTGKNSTISVYDKKAVLKIKSPEMTAVATKFSTSPGLSESDFDIPTDVEFIDMEDMMKGMKNLKNLDKLKDMKMPGSK